MLLQNTHLGLWIVILLGRSIHTKKRQYCCLDTQRKITRHESKFLKGVEAKYSSIIFNSKNQWLPPEAFAKMLKKPTKSKKRKKIPFNCNKTFYRSWKNTAKQLNHMHRFLNYEQTVSSYRLCILRWPSPVLLQFMKHDKTTDKVDLCCRLFVLSTQMVCHNAMSPNTVSSFFSFICFTEVL